MDNTEPQSPKLDPSGCDLMLEEQDAPYEGAESRSIYEANNSIEDHISRRFNEIQLAVASGREQVLSLLEALQAENRALQQTLALGSPRPGNSRSLTSSQAEALSAGIMGQGFAASGRENEVVRSPISSPPALEVVVSPIARCNSDPATTNDELVHSISHSTIQTEHPVAFSSGGPGSQAGSRRNSGTSALPNFLSHGESDFGTGGNALSACTTPSGSFFGLVNALQGHKQSFENAAGSTRCSPIPDLTYGNKSSNGSNESATSESWSSSMSRLGSSESMTPAPLRSGGSLFVNSADLSKIDGASARVTFHGDDEEDTGPKKEKTKISFHFNEPQDQVMPSLQVPGKDVRRHSVQKDSLQSCSRSSSRHGSYISSSIPNSFHMNEVWKKKKVSTIPEWLSGVKAPIGADESIGENDMALAPVEDDESDDSSVETRNVVSRCWQSTCFQLKCPISPNSGFRAFWDMMSCLLVFYDMVMIPMELMEPPQSDFVDGVAWASRIFWTLDMVTTSLSGFIASDGKVESRWPMVLLRYCKTWLLFDILLVAVEWVELAWSQAGGVGVLRAGRTGRIFRIIRLVRLLRLVRLREVISAIAERIHSERLFIAADILKICVVIVGFAHLMACCWYGLGMTGHPDGNWYDDWVLAADVQTLDLNTRYSAALHWSLSQFAGGMDEIKPSNSTERYYAIGTFLFAFLLSAVLVSRLTSSMTRLYMLSNSQQQQMVILRRYLAENGISPSIAQRVLKSAQHSIAEHQKFTPEVKVELLLIVSVPLRMELHFEIYHQVLSGHPFFSRYMEEYPNVMRKVCHIACSQSKVSQGDVLFTTGEVQESPVVLFVTEGHLEYRSYTGEVETVNPGHWISEMCIWTSWVHRGTLLASTNCRMSILDAKKFQNIAGRFDHLTDFAPRVYAEHYCKKLNELASDDHEITDLTVVPFPMAMLAHKKNTHHKGHEGRAFQRSAAPKGMFQIAVKSFKRSSVLEHRDIMAQNRNQVLAGVVGAPPPKGAQGLKGEKRDSQNKKG